jgi:YggT family protein
MDQSDSTAILRSFWYYYIAYYFVYYFVALLAARLALSLFVAPASMNVVWRLLVLVTDPLLRLVAPLTPGFLAGRGRPIAAAVWLVVLLFAYWLLLYQFDLAPTGETISGR